MRTSNSKPLMPQRLTEGLLREPVLRDSPSIAGSTSRCYNAEEAFEHVKPCLFREVETSTLAVVAAATAALVRSAPHLVALWLVYIPGSFLCAPSSEPGDLGAIRELQS